MTDKTGATNKETLIDKYVQFYFCHHSYGSIILFYKFNRVLEINIDVNFTSDSWAISGKFIFLKLFLIHE